MSALQQFNKEIIPALKEKLGVKNINSDAQGVEIDISVTDDYLKYIVEKGSITVDGISLTLVNVEASRFSVALIPHTLSVTTLGQRSVGDSVNIETDIIGKYMEKMLGGIIPQSREKQVGEANTNV